MASATVSYKDCTQQSVQQAQEHSMVACCLGDYRCCPCQTENQRQCMPATVLQLQIMQTASSVFLTTWPLFSAALTLTQRAGGLLTTHICLCWLWLIVHFCAACIFADLVYELGSKWQLAVFLQQWARFCLAIVTFTVWLPIPLGRKSADFAAPLSRMYESFRAHVNLLGRGRLGALLPL